MFNGWFCLGGTEIINNSRAEDYARTSPCGITWFKGPYCEGLRQALMTEDDYLSPLDSSSLPEGPYEYEKIPQAPWYDPNFPRSREAAEFLGVYCLSVDGLDDDTTEAEAQERLVGGAVIGRQRDRSKVMRFRVVLTAMTERGLEYGRTWLANILRESSCSIHPGGSCGTASLTFFTACPPPFVNTGGGAVAYWGTQALNQRILHGVKCTTGLLKEQEFERVTRPSVTEVIRDLNPESPTYGYILNNPGGPNEGSYGGIYEFTLTAEQPRMFGVPAITEIPVTGRALIQDAVLNLVPTPSAELASGTVEVSRNYSTNPSVETNATGWAATSTAVSGSAPAAYLTSGRVTDGAGTYSPTGGTASFRGRVLGNGSTAASGRAYIDLYQDISISTPPVGTRFSYSMWVATIISAGAGVSTIHAIWGFIQWRDGGGTVLRTDIIGKATTGFNGTTFKRASILPPAGAVTARCVVRGEVSWTSSATPANNSDIRVYADALALTVP